MTLLSMFSRGVLVAGERPFLLEGDQQWSYSQADRIVRGIAAWLAERGVAKASPVAVLSPNSGTGFMAILAVVHAGGVWVPLNVRNEPQSSAAYLKLTGTRLCLVHDDLTELADRISGFFPEVEFLRLSELPLNASATVRELPDVQPDDLAVLMPTGGTTGEPKAARLTHRVFDVFAANFLSCMPVADHSATHLMVAPMTHAAGFLAFALMGKGASNVIHHQVEPSRILADIANLGVTHVFLPPTVIYMLLSDPELNSHDYSSLQNFVYAAAPMSVTKLRAALDAFGPVMTQVYGQAEAPMTVTYLSPEDHVAALRGDPSRLASCGRQTPFVDLVVLDADGAPVGAGVAGEVCVRGDLVMEGYLGGQSVDRRAWHHTGDVGHLDADGYLYITDRIRDMIISGGFNIYPAEIEQVLWSHSAVQDCAVIGVPDDKWGEAVTAVVQLRAGHTVDSSELTSLVRDRLGGMKTPKAIHFWSDLPRSPVGKVLRREVRDRFWGGRERAV